MIWIIQTWEAIIVLEIIRNWFIIEVQKKRPNYFLSNVLRFSVAFAFWLISPVMFHMNEWQWWGMLPMMYFTFWFCFDYGLTWFRNIFNINNAPHIIFHYLNPNGSLLDQLQCKYPNTEVWFYFKAMLMCVGIALFYYGIDSIWIVKIW